MPISPLPALVSDPKDAILWAVLNQLENIDDTTGTRMAFATSVAYNIHLGLDRPIFEDIIREIRTVLKVPEPVISEVEEPGTMRADITEFDTMRDL
jgi:hypothetical protein